MCEMDGRKSPHPASAACRIFLPLCGLFADYIQLYHGNASLLAESLEVIQKTASVILAALWVAVSGG